MSLVEEDINNSNEKEINIVKEDSIKSNSLLIKSIDEPELNFIEFIKNKLVLTIVFNDKLILPVQLKSQSILKIFNLFRDQNNNNDEEEEEFENILTQYITFTLLEEMSYKAEMTTNSEGVLDTPYIKLLEQTKIYKISITSKNINDMEKDLLNNDNKNIKIFIKSTSLERICKNLDKTILNISDYIGILILHNNENDIDKNIIKKKLIDKYDKNGQNEFFMGLKNFETDCKVPIKCNKNTIYRINILFSNVLGKIENKENNNNSFDDDFDKEEKIINNSEKKKVSKEINEDNIKSQIVNNPNNYNIDEKKIKDDFEKEGGCQKELCPQCNII